MRNIFAACVLPLLIASCTKNTGAVVATINTPGATCTVPPSAKITNLVFGVYDYPHMSNNVPFYKFYFADGSKVFSEMPDLFGGRPRVSNLISQSRVMVDSVYGIVQPLMDGFPTYLLNNPNAFIGCSGSDSVQDRADLLYISIINGTDTTTWNINMDTAVLPTAIKPYVLQVQQVWNRLYKL